MTNPQVDIIIPTRGRGALVDVTIDSIRHSDYPDFRLWVVDQSEDDATEQAVSPHCRADRRVRYLRSRSQGSNLARDEGVTAGQAPYILFTDDDCRVEPGWVTAMTNELHDRETSAVFGRILPDEEFHAELPAEKSVSPAIRIAVKDFPERQEFAGNRFRLDFGHGANMGLRRDAYQAVGGFDLLLGCGGPLRAWPERDLGYRILSRGGRIIYTPDAVVHHRHWRDWPEVRRTFRNYAFGTGAVAGKYLRSGDWGGAYVLVEWLLDQGARQVLSGILKWRSLQKIEVGLMQMIYPWVGLLHSLRYPVDRKSLLYQGAQILPDDAVTHFSEVAREFDGHYEDRPEFKERLALWRRLIDEHNVPGGRVVDLGCGSGVFSFIAAEKAARVIGVDGAPEMVKLCDQRRRDRHLEHVHFVQGRLPALEEIEDEADLGNADLVICSSVLEYVDDLDQGLALLSRLTRPGGTVLVSMPNLFGLSRLYQRLANRALDRSSVYRHIRHFTSPALFRRAVARHGLSLQQTHYYDHHTRLAGWTHRMGLPPSLTEDLFVAVCRKE
jgi:2-polyprenyl-3-methyl-5-hydroxy-6-metoxy-1,4-benzoquinol methylase/GT2 family glycosyltransferase